MTELGYQKHTNFEKYCPICKHSKEPESESPCNECLAVGGREYTEKPEYFEECTSVRKKYNG